MNSGGPAIWYALMLMWRHPNDLPTSGNFVKANCINSIGWRGWYGTSVLTPAMAARVICICMYFFVKEMSHGSDSDLLLEHIIIIYVLQHTGLMSHRYDMSSQYSPTELVHKNYCSVTLIKPASRWFDQIPIMEQKRPMNEKSGRYILIANNITIFRHATCHILVRNDSLLC